MGPSPKMGHPKGEGWWAWCWGGMLDVRAHLAQEVFDGDEALDVDQLEQAQLEMEALFLSVAQLVEGAEHDGEEAREVFFGEERGGTGGAVALFGRDLEEVGGDAGGVRVGCEVRDLGDDGVAQVADELAGELRRSIAGVEQAANDREDVGRVVGVNGLEDLLVDNVRD